MISAQVLNRDASLNDFEVLEAAEFIPGEQIRFVFRLIDTSKDNLRYIPPSTNITTIKFNKTDGTTLDKTATVLDADDRSLLYVDLQEAETEDLLGGNIYLELDIQGDASEIRKGAIFNGLQKIIVGDC